MLEFHFYRQLYYTLITKCNLLLVNLLLFFLPASASFSELTFDIFTQENGLPNNQIQCIYQDCKGWIWIGTSQGLSRFDGYSFVNFLPNPDDSTSLKGNLVRVIKEDLRGNLLVGTENGGLNVFNRELERFSHPFENFPELKFREISVNDIADEGNGNFYIGTDFNILRIDSLGTISVLKPETAESKGFEGNFVRNLQTDQNGILWVGTNDRLFTYNPKTNLIEPFQLPFKSGQNKEIWEIFLDDDGIIWVGTHSAGLYMLSPKSRSVSQVLLTPEVNRNETVRSITKGVFGEFWIGTRGGLYVYSKEKNEVTGFYRHDERDPRSISNNSVLSILNDKRGETWIGTRGEVIVFNPEENRITRFPEHTHTLFEDSRKQIWIATFDKGVAIYSPENGPVKYYKFRLLGMAIKKVVPFSGELLNHTFPFKYFSPNSFML